MCVCMCMKYIKNIRHASMCHVSLYDFLLLFLNDKKNACVKSISPLSCLPLLNRRKCVCVYTKNLSIFLFLCKILQKEKEKFKETKSLYVQTHTYKPQIILIFFGRTTLASSVFPRQFISGAVLYVYYTILPKNMYK